MNTNRMYTTQWTLLLVLALILSQTACGESQSATAPYFGGMILKIESDRSSLKNGESVHTKFRATNTGSQPIAIESQDTPVLDIIVEEVPSRRKLASWANQYPDKVSHYMEWKPGESKVIELTWTYSGHESLFADVGGFLYENSRGAQIAGVRLCLEPCRP